MGFFNILNSETTCKYCRQAYPIEIQFKFSHTRQLEYRVGDQLIWGGNDVGIPNLPSVKVYGITYENTCPNCGGVNNEEYDIMVKNDRIVGVEEMRSYDIYFSTDDGCYSIVELPPYTGISNEWPPSKQ